MLNRKFIIIMRLNKSLNYKNLESYKIKKIINNTIYELNLFDSMNSIYSIFHFWLLHLKKFNSLFEQREIDSKSIEIVEKLEWEINRVIKSRIYKRFNDFVTNKKSLFQYKIKFKKWNTYNQTFKWKSYEFFVNTFNAITDFHYHYSKKIEFHAIFQRFVDWKSSQ